MDGNCENIEHLLEEIPESQLEKVFLSAYSHGRDMAFHLNAKLQHAHKATLSEWTDSSHIDQARYN